MKAPAAVDPNEFDSLNREFYHADPADVIEQRVWMLVRYLGDVSTDATVPFDDIALNRDEVPDEGTRTEFAALESMLIMHQAAEALLRLYLAHAHDAECPWVEMTKLRQPRVFPQLVSEIARTIDTDATIDELLRVISWSANRCEIEAGVTWQREGGWERHREGLRRLIQHCAELVLEGAELYNAGKHGLAILPSEKGVKIGDGEVISTSGPSLTVIERCVVEGDPRWAKVTHWISYKRAIALTTQIAVAIRSMWECGKQRRVGGGDQSRVHIFDVDLFDAAMNLDTQTGFNTTRMSEVLFDVEHPLFVPEPPHGQ